MKGKRLHIAHELSSCFPFHTGICTHSNPWPWYAVYPDLGISQVTKLPFATTHQTHHVNRPLKYLQINLSRLCICDKHNNALVRQLSVLLICINSLFYAYFQYWIQNQNNNKLVLNNQLVWKAVTLLIKGSHFKN